MECDLEMTREDAIQMIQDDVRLHHDALSGQYRKALHMAIGALLQPEIVRCRDCMHSEPSMFSKGVRCKLSLGYHELDWFCPEGERKQS